MYVCMFRGWLDSSNMLLRLLECFMSYDCIGCTGCFMSYDCIDCNGCIFVVVFAFSAVITFLVSLLVAVLLLLVVLLLMNVLPLLPSFSLASTV